MPRYENQAVPCPAPDCPGCPLLALPYGEQLERKHDLLTRTLAHYFPTAAIPVPAILPVRPGPRVFAYRASAKLSLSRDAAGVRIGIYGAASHRVIDLPRCPIHHPLVASGIRALRSLLARAPGLLSGGIGGQGWLRYAAFQASLWEEKLFVTLVTRSPEEEGLLRSLAARLKEKVPQLSGVGRNVNPSPGNEIFADEWTHLWGEAWLRERLGDLVFRASPPSFLQANREQAGWVYRMAPGWLAPASAENALDLYSGVGGLALHLAPKVRRIVGIEGSVAAVADAVWTAHSAGLENTSFLPGRVEEVLPRLVSEGYRPAVVSLNPPRRGVSPPVLQELRALQPRAILYVSCNPETLGRDAALLCAGGAYRAEMIQPVDFFPQTEHLETVSLLRRA